MTEVVPKYLVGKVRVLINGKWFYLTPEDHKRLQDERKEMSK